MWEAISHARKTRLVPIQGNVGAASFRDEITQSHLLPDIDVRGEMVQQDNARPDTAHNNGLPAKSEHCCDSIAFKIYRFKSNRTPMGWIGPARATTPITTTNPSGVTTSTYEYEWQIIPQVRIHGLIESLSRRVQTVLQINGGLNRCWICRC